MRKHRQHLLACVGILAAAAGTCQADEVTHWNEVLLQAIRDTGGPPCPIGRAICMTQVAVFDAVNSIDRGYDPYLGFVPAAPGASLEAAAAVSAHDMLVHLYPTLVATFDAELVTSLGAIPDGQSKTDGIAVGHASAVACILSRVDDGSEDNTPYVFGTNAGDYYTPEDFPGPPTAFSPNWGHSRPFTFTEHDQFLPQAGPLGFHNMNGLLHSRQYAVQFDEVKSLGSRNSTTRTEDQTQLAFFWANDVNGTSKPPGQLCTMAQIVSANEGLSLVENARLFGLVGLAMGDAGVVAWNAKYDTNIAFWRPISGIRSAHLDGNHRTTRDANWLPLNPFTPPFPAWISGHSTFGGAWAGVMAEYFGTDNMTYDVTTEDPFYAALPSHPPTRTFHTFSSAGFEDAISRVYLGVHWRTDCEDGYSAGQALGHHIGQNFLRPSCAADFNRDGRVNSRDVHDFLHAFMHGDPAADFNGDGKVNGPDLIAYMQAYLAGC